MPCAGMVQLQCPTCSERFCVPAVCHGHIVWHRGCDGEPLREVVSESGDQVTRAVVSWFQDTGRNEVRACTPM